MPLNNLNRRSLIIGAGALALPMPAFAQTESQARRYVERIIEDVMGTINSNAPLPEIYRRFGTVFTSYADIPTIARLVLGAPWRSISRSKQNAFADAFGFYLSQIYSRRFAAYKGAVITINRVQDAGRKGVLVYSSVQRTSGAPFNLDWQVSDGSGQIKMIDMIIEGISLISSSREEVRAMLAQNRGNVDALISVLLQG